MKARLSATLLLCQGKCISVFFAETMHIGIFMVIGGGNGYRDNFESKVIKSRQLRQFRNRMEVRRKKIIKAEKQKNSNYTAFGKRGWKGKTRKLKGRFH